MQYLAITDADAIHSYVFAPRELRLIRGGSSLLKECNEEVVKILTQITGRCIFSGGGQVLAVFPGEEQAREYCRAVKSHYRDKTGTATVSAAFVPYPSSDQFETTHQKLLFELDYAKQHRAAGHFNGGSPYFASCQACGLYPAGMRSNSPEPKLICHPCHLREEQARAVRGANENKPQTFEDIARNRHPKNYLAMIYCDFDRLGRYLQETIEGREDRYAILSKRVNGAIEHAVKEAGKQAPGSVPLIVGGDDAVVVMAAEDALAFLRAFKTGIDEFWRRDEQNPEKQIHAPRPSFSAGMVLAHSHFPISEFMRIAEDLLRSAKRVKNHDTIDYEVVTNSMVGDVLQQRRRFNRLRTAKPYTWEDFLALANELHELKKHRAPASKVKALYHIAYQSDLQAEMEYLHLLSRLEARHREIMRKPQAVGLGLWQKSERGAEVTRAADLAELWEFVRECV